MKRVNEKSRDKRQSLKGVYLGAINGLVRELHSLESAPAVSFSSPHFIKHHPLFNKAASYEGMLGAVMLESFLAGAFFGAANENSTPFAASNGIGVNDAIDIISETLEETGEGQGTFARVKWRNNAPALPFNEEAAPGTARRRKIEAALADYTRRYDALPAFEAA